MGIRSGKAAAALPGQAAELHGRPVELTGALARTLHSERFNVILVPKRRGDRGLAYPSLLGVSRRACEASDDGPFSSSSLDGLEENHR
jgi:hypothetical protein